MLDQKELIHTTPWDNLIIFDACRYDAFEMKYKDFLAFEGELVPVWSSNSCTKEWLHETWSEDYQDVTYISSNIFMRSRRGEHDFQYKPIRRFGKIIDAWEKSLHPEEVDKHALVTKGRKVLHYLTPHKPCYGRIKKYTYDGYLANLEYIMERMTNIIPKLGGLTIITSDHGELWRQNGNSDGHRCNKNHPDLRTVPWFTVKERKT
jgi:hypothetical protein